MSSLFPTFASPMHSITHYRDLVENGLAELDIPADPSELYEPVRYVMSLGGKRFRPVLLLMSADIFLGNMDKVLPAALAIEVFHNFTLVHDDLMDMAEMRRGKQAVHKKWNADTAILSGDVMLVLAYDLLLKTDVDKLPGTIAMFNESAKRVCEGQQLDMVYQSRLDIGVEEYLHMISLKTAALLAGSLSLGAHLADASGGDIEHIKGFGYAIGTAFQVQDDLLDAFGDSERFGKKIGGDIIANKKTCLTLKAFELAEGNLRRELEQLYGVSNNLSPQKKIGKVLEIYERLGIREYATRLRDEHYKQALRHLDRMSVPQERKAPLYGVASELIVRES